MSGSLLTIEDAQAAEISVVADGTGSQAVHDVVTAMRANRRSGSANSKTRGEVSGSNAKPWRQKGTGRARSGEKRSPIWRGGGVVFGPRPRDYSKSVNKSTRKLALRATIGSRIAAGDVISVADFSIPSGKTKDFIAALSKLADARKVLVVAAAFDEPTYLSARNHGSTLLMTASEVNVEQLLDYHKIVVTQDALPVLARRTQK